MSSSAPTTRQIGSLCRSMRAVLLVCGCVAGLMCARGHLKAQSEPEVQTGQQSTIRTTARTGAADRLPVETTAWTQMTPIMHANSAARGSQTDDRMAKAGSDVSSLSNPGDSQAVQKFPTEFLPTVSSLMPGNRLRQQVAEQKSDFDLHAQGRDRQLPTVRQADQTTAQSSDISPRSSALPPRRLAIPLHTASFSQARPNDSSEETPLSAVQVPAPARRATPQSGLRQSLNTQQPAAPALQLPTFGGLGGFGTPTQQYDDSFQLPLGGAENLTQIEIARDGESLQLSFHEAPLREVLAVLAESQGLNIICAGSADTTVTGSFNSITFEDAMNAVLAVSGHSWIRRNNVIVVTSLTNENRLSPEAQGREIRVFTLNYIAAVDVQKACTGLMSPSGTIVTMETDPADSQKTREQVMVEDLPGYLERVAQLISMMDVPPRQVLIEAHILQVDLKNNLNHGIDFAKLASIAGNDILLSTPGFNGTITDLNTLAPASYNIGIFNAGSFSGLIELLEKTTDAKTLASPKVLALNGQAAHVQIGKRLGYYVTTTTQTSTLQSVQFLDTGVVLTVTPRITADNQVLLSVKPEVSDGSVDALGLPSSTTTEVETNIMLPDGKGMVIGGLIKETDVTTQQKIPVLGSLWGIGRFFRRNAVVKERNEIIIALVPHIIHGPCFDDCEHDTQLARATTPLLFGALERYPRPWEPSLPDAVNNPRRFSNDRAREGWNCPSSIPEHSLDYYFPANSAHGSEVFLFDSIPLQSQQPSWHSN